ncbi:MAG: penicillin-binding protein [bacterium]
MNKIISIMVGVADFIIEKIGIALEKATFFVRKLIHLSTHHISKTNYKTSKKRLLVDALLVLITLAFLGLAVVVFWAVSLKTPSPDSFDNRLLGQSAKIYDRTGTILLYDLSQKIRRTVVPFDKISPYIKKASIAIEDENFYQHGGIQAKSIIRAIFANILSLKFSQGGSTITQQVVKNSLLSNDKSIARKIKEWILSIKLEQVADKDTILNMYLNGSPYGGNIYGVGEATEQFFGKKPDEVNLAEAAYIAALPQSPTTLSPYGTNTQKLEDRKNTVLRKMLDLKTITQSEYDEALKIKVVFQPKNLAGIKAPHFVMYIKDYLENKYGDDMLQNGGLKIVTTLDYDLQQKTEDIVKKYVIDNQKNFKATNGSMVATDPKTGQILMMVGSRDYFDKDITGNFNVATARRQPGSSFKPFVYGTAFNQGYLPETPVFDVNTEFNSGCTVSGTPISGSAKCYHPQNYSLNYKGLMSFRQALGASQNIPAVKVLYLVGVDNAIKTARAMGIEGLSGANQYGLSLALGGAEVSLLDMTSAYGVFANNGLRNPTTGVLSVTTADGQVLESYDSQKTTGQQVIPVQTAEMMNDVLSDIYARNSIFTLSYTGDRQVAIKTGTTNSSRDAWTIGYTPSISIGAWMGNNDNTPMAQIASARIVSPMWKQVLDYALQKVPVEQFEKPVYDDSAKKPFIRGVWHTNSGEVHSELYWIDRSNPMGPQPSNPSSDPEFNLWEAGVTGWAQSGSAQGLLPQPVINPLNQSGAFGVRIDSPVYTPKNNRITVSVYNYAPETSKVDYTVNGESIGTATQAPFSILFTPAQVKGLQDENEIKATAFDLLGRHFEATTVFSTDSGN